MGEKHSFEKPMGGFVQPRNAADTSAIRGHFVAASGEFVGTFMFLLFAFLGHQMSASQQVATAHDGTNSNQTIIFIGMSYGLSLLVTAWTFYRISGGLFRYAPIVCAVLSRLKIATVSVDTASSLCAKRGMVTANG
jgi:aquaporin rerated protein, other eukaryote